MERLKRWMKEIVVPFELLRENGGGLLKFEAIYRLLTYLVVFPFLTWIFRFLPLVNGTNVIAAYNIQKVISNPFSWMIAAVIVLLLTLFASFERFAIIDALHAAKCGIRRSAGQIISTGFDLTIENCRPRNFLLIPYVLVILHFGSLIDISGITSFIRLPGSFWESLSKYPWQKAVYYSGVALAFWINVRCIFAMPIMLEEDSTNFAGACRKSMRMTKGRYWIKLLLLMCLWMALLAILASLLAFTVVLVWYLLSLWLQPGQTGPIVQFVKARYAGTDLVCGFGTTWVLSPLTLSSFQAAYYKRKETLGEKLLMYTEEPGFILHNRTLRNCLIAFCAICIFFSGPKRFSQIKWMMKTDLGTPLIMAHRGYSQAAPENTLPAFEKAIDAGFSAAELDVQMTKDNVIVVLHDSNLRRTTGVNANIWDVTYDEIRDLDNGSFFSREYAGTKIPTLEEVLQLCKDKLYLNIEIKRTGHDDGIAERVVELIEKYSYFDNCDVTSQDYATLEEIRAINPDILTAYTSSIGIGQIQTLEAADILSIMESSARYEIIDSLRNAGKRVFVWTVNEEETMERLINLNVDAILTNDPVLCQKVIDRYSSDVMNILRRASDALSFL